MSKFNAFGLLVILAASIGLFSCSQGGSGGNDPRARLTDYISKSFAVNGTKDRSELLTYLTGDAHRRLEAWSDDQFREAFIDSKRKFIKLSIKEVKNSSPGQAEITYEIVYTDQGKGHEAKVTNKKLCQMTEQNGKWFIADVQNIKELVEYTNELSLP